MTYSGAAQAAESRALLGTALEALQKDPKIPKEVLAVAENLAGAVGALFEAERASSDVDGKSSVKHAMGSLSQTMALLQDVKSDHEGIAVALDLVGQLPHHQELAVFAGLAFVIAFVCSQVDHGNADRNVRSGRRCLVIAASIGGLKLKNVGHDRSIS